MKVRNGFVTNSSSSSFILAFKDEADYDKFTNRCHEYGYEQLSNLIDRIRNSENRTNEQLCTEAIANLYHWTICDTTQEYVRKHIPSSVHYPEYIHEEQRIKESEEYKEHIRKFIATTDFDEKKKMLEDAEIIVSATIWDSNGGLLEFAIRNGLLQEWPIWTWLVSQFDIG